MKPAFKTALAWEQANLLLQPIMIRVIDNLRKQLEDSPWQGDYREIHLPYPGHQLLLTRNDHRIVVDIWQLCYQVCFLDYPVPLALSPRSDAEGSLDKAGDIDPDMDLNIDSDINVDIDTHLIDDTGEVDWQQLETKTQQLLRKFFASLPND
jgi:hypothetical protein